MTGMRMALSLQRRAAVAALPLALLASLAACSPGGDEPTAAAAGTQLQQAVQRLYDARLGSSDPSVNSDGAADQSCGDNRAKRVYAATVASKGFSDRNLAFEYAIGLMDDLGSGWERQSTKDSDDTVTAVGADGHARLSVTASQDGGSYSVAGQTDCLPSG